MLREAVEACTGPVITSESVTSGFNCSLALVVHTHKAGSLFLKGVRLSDDVGMAGLRCEEQIGGVVGGISPTIRYRFERAGWRCLAFGYVDGRHADYGPGTGDLGTIALTVGRMHQLPVPAVPLVQLSERFAGCLRPGEADALKGSHLLHTDMNPHNVLIGAADGRAYVVDWAMPAIGPAWVDAAYLATWLMSYGHTPEDAHTWLSGQPSWRQADRGAVEAFVAVTCRDFSESVGEENAATSNARFRHLLDFMC
ncbi:phosphotransferase [Streptomyces albipurpureus]|uniref:phosphotransferase n=1 Tax=Streptomyces albipurpureus TaxID=2897419 RepID=UPI0027E44930|nr:phosphotransferase [Streptomyces sp. CWNU-1]